MAGILVRSTEFNDHDLMPERVSQTGGNISPELEWFNVPEEASELVLLVEDGDAVKKPFLHWVVVGIDPTTTGVGEGQVPRGGRELPNSYGESRYCGPRPPKGDDPHRYFFRIYALDRPLDLPGPPKPEEVFFTTEDRELASGVIVGTFAR